MNRLRNSSLSRGYAIALLSTVVWASTAVFARYLNDKFAMPPLSLAFWRDFIVSCVMLVILLVFSRNLLRQFKGNGSFFCQYGLVTAAFNILWTISIVLNGAAVSAVLTYCSTAFTAVLGRLIFKEDLGRGKVVAVILSLAGAALVSGAMRLSVWSSNWVGIVTGLLSGLSFAGYSLMGREAGNRQLNPWATLFFTFATASVYLGLINLFVRPNEIFWLQNHWDGWALMLILAIGPTLCGYGLYTVSLTLLPASVANLISTLEPIFTSLLAFLILGEQFTYAQWIGGILIFGGVILLRISEGSTIESDALA